MKKFVSAVSAIAMAVTSAAASAFMGASAESNTDAPIKIMCIGDSITDGYGVAGSYRKFLYNGLAEKGYDIDMIGSKEGWNTSYTDGESGESFTYDDGNTGYSGYAIKEYAGRNGIYETLVSTNCLSQEPDIVILQIGTNNIIDNHDMDENMADLNILVTYILDNIPESSALFVTTIPPIDPNRPEVYDWFGNYRHSADWQQQYDDITAEANVHKKTALYNTEVEQTVERIKKSRGNVYPAFVSNAITDVKTQLADGVHPNNSGYKAMGAYWTQVIGDYLQGGSVEVPTTAQAATAVQTATLTTTADGGSGRFTVSDLVLLSRYLVANKNFEYPAEKMAGYDLHEDGVLDVFDLILMRRKLIEI